MKCVEHVMRIEGRCLDMQCYADRIPACDDAPSIRPMTQASSLGITYADDQAYMLLAETNGELDSKIKRLMIR